MLHITGKYKCKDKDGDEHIVLTVAYWDTGLNKYVRKDMIEIPGHTIASEDGVDTGYYPTTYLTAGEMDIELELQDKIEI